MNENFIKNYEYYKDISLKKYNTYRLDVKCGYLIYPGNTKELIDLLKYLKENNINYFILGGGSNIILAKPYFDVVIKLDKLNNIKIKENIVTAEAGVSLIYLANLCMNNNLNGLAFAGGIPGMVGASTAMNAGAYKEDMASIVKEVKVVTPELEVIRLTNKDLNYSYRNSFLKEHKDYICTEVTLEMSYLDKDKIKETMTSRKKRRIDTQPLDKPSAGSVFRNPEGLSAGKLIEDAGLKGYKIGGAEISTKHANFIVNTGDATYEDILELIDYTKKKIKEIYNIDLILEQEIISTAGIDNYPSFIDTSKKDIITRLKRNNYIKEVKVEKKLLSKIYIYITEYKVISLYNDKLLLDNNTEIENTYNIYNIPILISDISSIREKYTKSISKIDDDILLKISQIEYTPNDVDSERFTLYMNDGNQVYITLGKVTKINKYNSIYSRLEGKKGIIYLDSGDYIEVKEE